MSNFNGTIYEYGEPISGIVDTVVVPHVWYDQSKELNVTGKIFDEISVAESLFLGETQDDVNNYNEILVEILQYLNLHIIQIGYDMYIFDWDTIRTKNTIVWYDIFTEETKTQNISDITVLQDDATSDGTQVGIADVYNQIIVTDETLSYEDVIVSPFDSDNLYSDYAGPQLVMREFVAEGEGDGAAATFYNMMTHYAEPDASYGHGGGSKAYYKDWYAQVMKNKYWNFKLNGNDCYDACPKDANGHYHSQYAFLEYLHNTNFASGILAYAGGMEQNEYNMTQVENIASYKNCIVFAIHGNGSDGKPMPLLGIDPPIFPSDSDLENMNMEISYKYPVDGNFSPSEENMTNYLVFSGTIIYDKWVEKTGRVGFGNYISVITGEEYPYVRALRQTNAFNDSKLWLWNNASFFNDNHELYTVPCPDNEDGMFYQQRFYKFKEYDRSGTGDNAEMEVENNNIFMTPFIDYGEKGKMYKYFFGRYYDNDVIGLVPVLECQLKIGDKYLVETYDSNGNSIYTWTAEEDLDYYIDEDINHTVRYINTFRLGFNPKKDDYIVGQEHPIKNTVTTEMRLGEITGTAIPIKKSDNLHGTLEFKIIGPCNSWWDDGIYTHKTWFRHSAKTENAVPILSMVDSIKITDFDVKFRSGNQSNQADNDKDIVYASDEVKQYINKKDDITFRINTALTKEEADAMQVSGESYRSLAYDAVNECNILGITNNLTNETDKPERHYVDAYFREYSQPKIILDTDVKNVSKFNEFNRFNFNYFSGRSFYPIKKDYNLKYDTVALKLKEI